MSRAFRFKQFSIQQERSAMKICTDSCLFGAWAAKQFAGNADKNLLDVGSGTGLLSLMIAQKFAGRITAVELDEAACAESDDNFRDSPFASRLTQVCGDIRTTAINEKFDIIVSNPPFFKNDLRSPDESRNRAMHGSDLSFEDLASLCAKHLRSNGRAACLVAAQNADALISTFREHGLHLTQQIDIRQTPDRRAFRSICSFKRKIATMRLCHIDIRQNDDEYSREFTQLLKDYYLHL